MKTKMKLLSVALFSFNAAITSRSEGYIRFDNLPPAGGLVYLASNVPGGQLLDQDVNFQLIGGSDPFGGQVIHTWLLSDGSAAGINVSPGRFQDPSHSAFGIPGVQPGDTAYMVLWAWTGNFNTFEDALRAGTAGTTAFPNPTGDASSAPGLTGMSSFVIGIPEPSVLSLATIGAVGLLVWRRRGRGLQFSLL